MNKTSMEKQPLYVHCVDCKHEWVWVYTPLKVSYLKDFKAGRCIYCHEKNIAMGTVSEAAAHQKKSNENAK